jgi:hypothetical protein
MEIYKSTSAEISPNLFAPPSVIAVSPSDALSRLSNAAAVLGPAG